ncbi:MAG TPA: response regulator transcription factor [Dehalococcoidia bacterium]|jgi:DNA-binding NarL/FixJ family response regulator|nr:response regulator transcription factor [Dehalococcoidia bacterium]
MKRLRLLLVDDHALFREGLSALFSYEDGFEVVGEAEDAAGAIAQARALSPDIVLMDIDLPDEDGVSVTRKILAEMPDVAVVMLTVHDETDKLIDAIKAGAQGYLVKNTRSAELVEQLRGVADGEAAISRRIATRLLEEFRRSDEPDEPEANLTTRELEILTLVADRMSNLEIANQLVISEHTVKNHIKNILAKLHLRSRRHAAAYGIARGWVRPTATEG